MAKVIELYVCSICGITNETHKSWGPICRKTGKRVCDVCCLKCEHHFIWSGLWDCGYRTAEELREERRKRARDRFEAENLRISKAYHARRKEEARQWAIKQAKARAKTKTGAGGVKTE